MLLEYRETVKRAAMAIWPLFFICHLAQADEVANTLDSAIAKSASIEKDVRGYFGGNFYTLHKSPPQRFIQKIDSLRAEILKPIARTNFAVRPPHDTHLRNRFASAAYFRAKALVDYPEFHKRFTGETISSESLDSAWRSELDFANDSNFTLPAYQEFTEALLRRETLELISDSSAGLPPDNRWTVAKFRLTQEMIHSEVSQGFWLHRVLISHIEELGVKNLSPLVRSFETTCSDSSLVGEVLTRFIADSTEHYNHTILTYKTVGDVTLNAHIFFPDDYDSNKRYPVYSYFHGGSYYTGSESWFFPSAKKRASEGFIAIAVEYRLYDRHGVTPLECMSDAKTFFRWLRVNADSLGVDTTRIAAFGASAGGQMIVFAASSDEFNEPGEDTTINSSPTAMIFYYTAFDLTGDRWFENQVGDRATPLALSPISTVHAGMPPALIVHGTQDRVCSYSSAKQFTESMINAGNSAKLITLQGAGHTFVFNKTYRKQASDSVREFLDALGFLEH